MHQFCSYMGKNCIIFCANVAHNKKYDKTAPSNAAISEEFNEQHQHQGTKKSRIVNAQFAFFVVQLR